MRVTEEQIRLTWPEATMKALANLKAIATEDEILAEILLRQYRSFERAKTPKRSLNRTLNEHLDGKVEKRNGKWAIIDEQITQELTEDETDPTLDQNEHSDSLAGIIALEKKMRNLTPSVRYHLSKRIERGTIAAKIKELLGYRCQLCEANGDNPFGFISRSGKNYIETHHVEQVSKLKKGLLSVLNLITVCPNHHRELHFGEVVVEDLGNAFSFVIGGKTLTVEKIMVVNGDKTAK